MYNHNLTTMRTYSRSRRIFNLWDARDVRVVRKERYSTPRPLDEGLWTCGEGDSFTLTFKDYNDDEHTLEYRGSGWFVLDGGKPEQIPV